MMTSIDSSTIATKLVEILLNHAACSSKDEAIVIADVLLEDIQHQKLQRHDFLLGSPECLEIVTGCLLENLDLSNKNNEHDDAKVLAMEINETIGGGSQGKEQQVSSVGSLIKNEPTSITDHGIEKQAAGQDDDDDEEHAPLVDGECELCDRYIQLTKHHLIPKSTWPRMEAKLMLAADAMEDGNVDKASMILGPGLIHLLEDLQPTDKHCIRQILHRTCDICRPCHSALHKAHDNTELALWYGTVDLILEDKQMASYCKWASKQRPGKYAVHQKKHY